MIEVLYNEIIYIVNIPMCIFIMYRPEDRVIIFRKGDTTSPGRRVKFKELTIYKKGGK